MTLKINMNDIAKNFGGVRALQGVSFEARGGEVHALLGENGAGKSTLMRILSGDHQPTAGSIEINDTKVDLSSPKVSRDMGIAVIYQEFSLAGDLSVAENIFLDDLTNGAYTIKWAQLRRRATELMASLGLGGIDVTRLVASLSVGEQQIVEICKALRADARIVVFDEPSAVLTAREAESLFKLIRRLKDEGKCIIYISHRLEEVFTICDRATILKDGKFVDTLDVASTTQTQLVESMVGRELEHVFPLEMRQFLALYSR